MNLIEKAKAHPWMTGALIIGGGLVFFVLSGWFTGGSSGGVQYVDDGPSDAEIQANAGIAAAQIAASAQNADTAASLALAKMGFEYQAQSDELSYDLGLQQLATGAQVTLAQIQAQLSGLQIQAGVANNQTNAAASISQATIDAQKAIALDNNKTQLGLVQSIVSAYSNNDVTTGPTTSVTPPSKNIGDYLSANPDIAQMIASETTNPKSDLYGYTSEQAAVWHQNQFGEEGRGNVHDYL